MDADREMFLASLESRAALNLYGEKPAFLDAVADMKRRAIVVCHLHRLAERTGPLPMDWPFCRVVHPTMRRG